MVRVSSHDGVRDLDHTCDLTVLRTSVAQVEDVRRPLGGHQPALGPAIGAEHHFPRHAGAHHRLAVATGAGEAAVRQPALELPVPMLVDVRHENTRMFYSENRFPLFRNMRYTPSPISTVRFPVTLAVAQFEVISTSTGLVALGII